jgi:protein-S-isoprenylcysteine O-methyltransferase Ste14
VVTGLYRYVRNPMYVGVVSAVLGQSMILENLVLLGYTALVWFISHLFVVTYEEPALRRTFGNEYQFYCANVPRWIPRLRAWTGS